MWRPHLTYAGAQSVAILIARTPRKAVSSACSAARPRVLSPEEKKRGAVTRTLLLERPVQRALIDSFAWQGCHAVHTPNGSHLAGGPLARAKQVAALKADGMRPGFPDLTVLDQRQPRVGFVEVKREGRDDLDPDQVWWRDELARLDLPWALANRPDQAPAILRAWGWR